MAYAFTMLDVMHALKDRRARAEAKLARSVKALEVAKKELADILAAERVMADITGESPDARPSSGGASDRDLEIAKILKTSPRESQSPAELYSEYVDATKDAINLDTFRTALWRLQKKIIRGDTASWTVKSENGKYWRERATADTDEFDDILGGDDDFAPQTN